MVSRVEPGCGEDADQAAWAPWRPCFGSGCSSSLSGLEQGRGWCFRAFWMQREGWGHTRADAETVEEEVEASRRFKR